MIKLGASGIGKLYLGETEIAKAYLGESLVYDAGGSPTPSILPSGYTELESVSNGTTAGQCASIKTGLVPTDANWRFVGSWKRTGTMGSAYCGVMNAYTAETVNCYRIIRANTANDYLMVNAYTRASSPSYAYSVNNLNTWYEYDLRYGTLVLNGTSITLGTTQGSGTMTGELSFGNSQFPQRIGRFTAYHNDVAVADMVPCKRDSDSVVGFYDIVRNTFYTSSNSYSFSE